ncbi:hypothetical protein [Alteromonas lipotrueiana]|uniref:hypothetical protein n=1 Tax=Alteromonas lipotrueiana TaxID=2803815 RepID=UPI001C489AFC|nr:hypothetical protein [Alteromonas lipotrueiana]
MLCVLFVCLNATLYLQLYQIGHEPQTYVRLFPNLRARLNNQPVSVVPVSLVTHVHTYDRTLIFCSGPFEIARFYYPGYLKRPLLHRCRKIFPVAGLCHHHSKIVKHKLME